MSGVAGAEIAVGRERLRVGLGVVVISGRHGAAFHQYLAVGVYLHLDAGQRYADSAYFPAYVGIACHRGRGLAEAIAYHDVDAHGAHELNDAVR